MSATEQQIEEFLSLFDGDVSVARSALDRYTKPSSPQTVNEVNEGSTLDSSDKPIIISVNHASKHYKLGKQTITALRDVSLDIRQGEFVAITGASGSGKSTLLHILGCLDKPTEGKVAVDGKDIAKLSDAKLSQLRKSTIGFIFQSFYLQPFLRLADNVAVPAMFTKTKRKTIDSKVSILLRQVGLDDQIHHFPSELSGGQIQRAAIARALMNNPRIVLADEPTGNLDSANSHAIIQLFKSIRDKLGTTIIVVTHDATIARQADRVIELRDGEVL